MSNMVYFLCSLPSLTLGEKPPISLDEFHGDAKEQLSSRQFELLKRLDIRGANADALGGLKSIAALLSEFQRDLSEIRKAKAESRQPNLFKLPKKVTEANPLEREQQIMRYQWEALDSIEFIEAFTLTKAAVYKLKLEIVIRQDSFDASLGRQILASVVNPYREEGKRDVRSEN